MYKRIIWATDGSVCTRKDLPLVRQVADESGAMVIVAHVQDYLMVGHRRVLRDDHRAHDAVLEEVVQDLIREGIDAELALTDSLGVHPAHVLSDLAMEAGADLIVAAGQQSGGTAGGRPRQRFTHTLLSVAPCPVLVIPRT